MIQNLLRVLLFAGLALVGPGMEPLFAQAPHTHQHSFAGAESWAKVFDDPARDAWQKPHDVIQALQLKPESVVADIGAGTGYFSARLARFVPKGRVYAVDIEPDMVKFLTDRAKRDGLTNVSTISGRPDDPRLPARVDVVLMVDVLHHIADRQVYLRKLRDSLKSGGRVAIIDFNQRSEMGPPKSARIAPDRVIAELKQAGYSLLKEHAFLPNQYLLIFQPVR